MCWVAEWMAVLLWYHDAVDRCGRVGLRDAKSSHSLASLPCDLRQNWSLDILGREDWTTVELPLWRTEKPKDAVVPWIYAG